MEGGEITQCDCSAIDGQQEEDTDFNLFAILSLPLESIKWGRDKVKKLKRISLIYPKCKKLAKEKNTRTDSRNKKRDLVGKGTQEGAKKSQISSMTFFCSIIFEIQCEMMKKP